MSFSITLHFGRFFSIDTQDFEMKIPISMGFYLTTFLGDLSLQLSKSKSLKMKR